MISWKGDLAARSMYLEGEGEVVRVELVSEDEMFMIAVQCRPRVMKILRSREQ